MRPFKTLVWITVSAFIFSCQNNSSEISPDELAREAPVAAKTDQGGEFQQADTSRDQQRPATGGQGTKAPPKPVQQDWDKKIVKTAVVNAEVKNYDDFYSSLRQKVSSVGGYIAGEDQSQTEYKIQNSVTIKVPVDQFDDALAALTAGTVSINEKKVNTQDVTGEMVDTRSRMQAKKQVKERYMELLKQAKNMEEILTMEREINGVQEQIESANGRINYLGYSSVFSTIHFTYFQVLNVEAKDKSEPGFGVKIKEAFGSGWNWISGFFVGIISIWPLFLLAFGVYAVYKRKYSKPKQMQEGL